MQNLRHNPVWTAFTVAMLLLVSGLPVVHHLCAMTGDAAMGVPAACDEHHATAMADAPQHGHNAHAHADSEAPCPEHAAPAEEVAASGSPCCDVEVLQAEAPPTRLPEMPTVPEVAAAVLAYVVAPLAVDEPKRPARPEDDTGPSGWTSLPLHVLYSLFLI